MFSCLFPLKTIQTGLSCSLQVLHISTGHTKKKWSTEMVAEKEEKKRPKNTIPILQTWGAKKHALFESKPGGQAKRVPTDSCHMGCVKIGIADCTETGEFPVGIPLSQPETYGILRETWTQLIRFVSRCY